MPVTTAALDGTVSDFNLGTQRGRYVALTPNLEWRWTERMSVFAALPVARVTFTDGPTHTGIGDLSVSAKFALVTSHHGERLLSAGLGVELPTGNAHHGLGGAHVELAPFVTGATSLLRWTSGEFLLHALISPRIALGGSHGHEADNSAAINGSALSPHASREVLGRLMAAATWGRCYGAAGAESTWAFGHDERDRQLVGRWEAGVRVSPTLRIFAAVDATLAGDRRFGTRARTGLAWMP